MARVTRSGQMGLSIWVSGLEIRLMGMGSYCIVMEMFMRETGWKIKHMGMASMYTQMELFMKDSGIMTSSMV